MSSLNKSSFAYTVLNRRQNALKLCANSVYGIMGSRSSKYFGHVGCAESITAMGRHWLLKTADLIPTINPNVEVIYGDTDSCTIHNVPEENATEIANFICTEINSILPSPMKLFFEEYYRCVVLLNKKKYVLLDRKDNIKYKGVMSARRDYCAFAKQLYISTMTLVAKGSDYITTIQSVTDLLDNELTNLVSGVVPISQLIITKSVNNVDSYKVIQTHVYMAKRLIDKGYNIPPGTRLELCYVQDGNTQCEKMRTVQEIEEENLNID